ncbi:MAG: hypothetical protein HKP54_13550 [Boseongicola sp.]|nr:hypothetical protein [Boseongicola sp.]
MSDFFRRWCLAPFAACLLILSAQGAIAQNLTADTVTDNGDPPRWGSRSCRATLPELSDGSNANPGLCLLGPVDPDYRVTFTFSPENAQFVTGIVIWANDGRNMNDNELRQLDVEVDYFDPTTNSTITYALEDFNIGVTTNFNDPKFVSFAGAGGSGLYRVSEVRLDNFVGRAPEQQATFREVQAVFATLPVAPEIEISSSEAGGPVADGGSDPQGVETSGVAKTVTYTIMNTGTDTLTLSGTPTVANVTNITGAVDIGLPGDLTLEPGESTTFDVTYTPAGDGAFSFDLEVPSNDPDESTYAIAVSGNANDAPGVALVAEPSPPNGPFPITATFSEPVTGMTPGDFNVVNGVATGFANPSPGVYTIIVTPTDPLLPVNVTVPQGVASDADGALNSASETLTFILVAAPTSTDLAAIEEIIVEETVRDMRNSIAFNQRATRNSRARHAGYLRCRNLSEDDLERASSEPATLAGCSAVRGISIEPDFNGKLSVSKSLSTGSGSFLTQKSSLDGTSRRLAFGELSFTRHEDDDVTATLNGRVAWEGLVGDDVLRGLFIGASAKRSDIEDDFTGNRTGFGLNAGAYFVDQLATNLYWDGFVTLGFGRNTLDLGNDALDVDGSYNTASVQVGLALSGQRDYRRFTLFPELSLAYGVASVGDADVTSISTFATTNDVVSVGSVALGVIRFRPEIVFAGEADRFGISRRQLSVAPSVLCETIRADASDTDCGGGLEIEWSSRSDDGKAEFSARVAREVVGGDSRDELSFMYERPF